MKLRLYPNNKKRLSVCPVFVRYRFLQNHWTEFDETLHALSTLPDNVKNAELIFGIAKKKNLFRVFSELFRTRLFGRLDRFRQTLSSHKKSRKFHQVPVSK